MSVNSDWTVCVRARVCVCASLLPAERPEPGEVVGVVDAVADGDDFVEALDLNAEDLRRETQVSRPRLTH